jgi:hypothetical protein
VLHLDVSAQSPQPLFWATLAFATGIEFATLSGRPPMWWLAATLILLVAAVFWSREQKILGGIAVLAAFLAVGALDLQLHDTATNAVDLGALADGRPVIVTAHVTRDAILRPGAFGGIEQSLDLESETIADLDAAGEQVELAAGVRLNI